MWKKIAAPVLVVVFFWGLSSIASTWYINSFEKSQQRMILEDLGTIRATEDIRYCVRRINRAFTSAAGSMDARTAANVDDLDREIDVHLQAATATSTVSEEFDLVNRISRALQPYRAEIKRQVAGMTSGRAPTEQDMTLRLRLADELSDAARLLGELNDRQMREEAAQLSGVTATLKNVRHGFLIVGPLTGIVCGVWISRWFNRSIAQISVTLSDAESEKGLGNVKLRKVADLPELQEQVARVVRRIQEVNEELQQARQKAISAARLAAVGEMSTGLAHELRNPMTSVKLLIQNAVDRHGGVLNERQSNVVIEELGRMERIISQLLDFTRPAKMNRVRHDVHSEIDRALDFARDQATGTGVAIELKYDPDAAPEAELDSDRFRQVLVNLFQNALEAMPAGGKLLVEILGTTDRVEVRVSDTGPGISEQVQTRLFEPFVTDKARGTGLGLAISRRIIEEHGGTLEGKNAPDGGAIFTIRLPRFPQPAPIIGRPAELNTPEARPVPELAHAQAAGR